MGLASQFTVVGKNVTSANDLKWPFLSRRGNYLIAAQFGTLMEVLMIGAFLTQLRRALVMPPIHVQSSKEINLQSPNDMLFLLEFSSLPLVAALVFILLIQIHYTGAEMCSVAGQHTSFQCRDSHGMRPFREWLLCTLLTWLVSWTFEEVLIQRCIFLWLSEAKDQVF